MKKIQYNGSSKILNGIVTKVNLIIDKLVVDVKVNGTSVVVVNEEGEREADIDLSLADQNVKQSPTTSSDNSDYRVLLSKSANDTEETDISRKDTNLKYNPSTGNLQTTKLNGNTVPSGSGNDTLAKTSDIPDMTNYIQKSLTVGLVKNDGTIDQTQYATLSDIPDELADLADDSTHRLVTDTEKSSWDAKANIIDITSAINDLDVASTSIGAGETLATIKEENGKISVTKQNISITNKQIANYCLVGTSNAISGSNTWHKVASVILDVANEDEVIMLAVNDTFPPDIDVETNGGILYCRARQNALGAFNYAKLKFVGNSGFDAKNFRLYYTIVSGTSITVEIWTSLSRQYAFRRFVVLSMGNRYQSNLEKWTLYNSTSPSAAPTESSTLKRVECEDNTYKQTDNNILGAKNLLKYPYYSDSYTSNGITWTLNADGTVTAKGTATANSQFYLHTRDKGERNDFTLPNGTYILSDGGLKNINTEIQMGITINGAWSEIGYTRNGDVQFTANGDDYSADSISPVISLLVRSGQQNVNVTFKPMIRLATIADNTYVPYAQTNRQLTIDKIAWNDYADYGVKNLIPYPWEHKNGRVNRGITFGCSGEGYVTFNGTASTTQEPFFSYTGTSSTSVANGTYLKISGNKRYRIAIERTDDRLWAIAYVRNLDGTDTSNLNIFVEFEDGSTAIKGSNINTRDSGISHKSLYFIIPNNNEYYIQVDIRCSANTGSYSSSTAKGRVILQPYEISDLSWMPYAKSNYELTTLKAEYKQIATVERTDNASKAYSVGDYMIWRGGFYVVRADIASGGAITLNTNVQATDLGSEVKKSKIWGNENIATIPNVSSTSKVYVTTSAYATEIYVQRMNIRSTSLGINETGYCSVTIPILPSMTNNYFVFMFRGDVDNKLYDGRLLFQKDSNGVYGYVSKVYQDGVLKSANDIEADIVVFEKS